MPRVEADDRLRSRVDAALAQAGERAAGAGADALRGEDIARQLATLSPRQMQILAHVFSGALNKTIADRLGINVKTVETHRARMMEKMSARSATELVARVARWRETREIRETLREGSHA